MSTVINQKKSSTLDKIRKYYLKGPETVELSEKQDEIRKRIDLAWNLLCNYGTYKSSAEILKNKEGCSIAQAYRYLNHAESLFGSVLKNNQKAKQFILEENVRNLLQKAIRNKDYTLEYKALSLLNKIYARNTEDKQDFNPEKFAAQTFVLKVDNTALEIMKSRGKGGAYDFNLMDSEAIPYKEVKENPGSDDE